MGKFNQARGARVALVSVLYALGLTIREVAEIIGRCTQTICHDISHLRGTYDFVARPSRAEEVYAAVIQCYARTFLSSKDETLPIEADDPRTPSQVTAEIRDALALWLHVDELRTFLRGIQAVLRLLMLPSCPSASQGYARLLGAVFERDFLSPDPHAVQMGESVWRETLLAIAAKQIAPPKRRQELEALLVQRMLEHTRARILPMWDKPVFDFVDQFMLDALTERERSMLRARFGIGTPEPQTLMQIAEREGISGPAVKQHLDKALRRLRQRISGRGLDLLIQPVGNALQRSLVRFADVEQLQRMTQDPEAAANPSLGTLLLPVQSLRLSRRAEHCLTERQPIQFVGDLVQWTEQGLLKRVNLGRRVLQEIKNALKPHGLEIGMGDWIPVVALFNQRRAELVGKTE